MGEYAGIKEEKDFNQLYCNKLGNIGSHMYVEFSVKILGYIKSRISQLLSVKSLIKKEIVHAKSLGQKWLQTQLQIEIRHS
jgi:hypothetical protein